MRFALAMLLCACSRESTVIARPAPEKSVASTPAPSPPAMAFDDVRCTYGGTAPAIFVWAEGTAKTRVHGLRAKSFEIRDPEAGWVNGAADAITLRTRAKKAEGDLGKVPAVLEPGTSLHLEIFGALRLDVFGVGTTYPTEARPFRAEIVSDEGTFTLSGNCVVGPAG